MFVNRKLFVCLAAATLIAGGALAQDSPSWRAVQEKPSRPEVPPEIERPEYEFSVSRDELMGFLPRGHETADPEPESAEPQRLQSDFDYGTVELVPAAITGADPAVEQPSLIGDATGEANIAPEEAFAGADFGQPGFLERFDTDPAPIPANTSAVAIETEPAAADREPETRDGARFAVSEMAGEEPDSIDPPARDEDLVTALDKQAGLAYVDAATAPPSELESVDQRASIAAALEREAAHIGATPAESDPEIAEALAPDAVTDPPSRSADIGSPTVDYRLVRRQTVEPEYPRHAYRARLEGWVNLRVTVAPNGAVENVEVTDAKPRRVFNESAIRAVQQWRFEPPQLAGVSTPQSGLYRISYTLQD